MVAHGEALFCFVAVDNLLSVLLLQIEEAAADVSVQAVEVLSKLLATLDTALLALETAELGVAMFLSDPFLLGHGGGSSGSGDGIVVHGTNY